MSAHPHRRTVLAGGLSLAAGRALAQDDGGLKRVVMKTGKGAIVLEIETAKAPVTARNFLRYVDGKLFDASSFYRVTHAPNAPEFGLIEGGLRGRKAFKPIAHESTAKTGLTHKDGTISMARLAPGTATADFFIVIGDHPGFDADPAAEGDNQGFAAFGRVVEGMDVVKAIFAQPVSPTAGVGAMKGQMMSPPVPIVSVRRA